MKKILFLIFLHLFHVHCVSSFSRQFDFRKNFKDFEYLQNEQDEQYQQDEQDQQDIIQDNYKFFILVNKMDSIEYKLEKLELDKKLERLVNIENICILILKFILYIIIGLLATLCFKLLYYIKKVDERTNKNVKKKVDPILISI